MSEDRHLRQPSAARAYLTVEIALPDTAAGVGDSDLHIIDAANTLEMPVPLKLGHENAGWIEALGAGVPGFERGDAAAIYGIIGCGAGGAP